MELSDRFSSGPIPFDAEKNNTGQVGTALKSKRRIYVSIIKRGLDLLISVLVLILLSPLMLVSALAVFLESGRPVFFLQDRIGYKGKVFRIYKFRSMVQNAEHTGSGVYSEEGDERVTRVGRILRALSIDELPQVINIIKGDMSLIGPRPPLTYHPWTIDKYTPEQLHMFDVRPGITGWAQIHGRKGVEWHRRIELNNWYVDHVSFPLDCKILFTTFFKVLSRADNVNKGSTVDSEAD
ncbi:MAG: sugar transferase [Oscillospiraceae bacterium]|nr:sugar transferase [Oscillospiraceae bacterium]MBR3474603.1 sugar transferase [Oscillospiraceae bacterium]